MATAEGGAIDGQGRRMNGLGWVWRLGAATIAILIIYAARHGLIAAKPSTELIPVAGWLSLALNWLAASSRGVFRALSAMLAWPLERVRDCLLWLPWPSVILLSAVIGHLAGGRRLAVFCGGVLGYIVITGYWEETAATVSLIAIAIPLSALIGFLLGVIGFRSALAWRVLEPILDLMQTIPTLAYLLPILALFGIGPLIGVVTSAIYAIPPMVRAVVHGLQRVPPEVVESGVMSGSTRLQLLAWVQIPSAMPTILLGLNQTVMAGLSMVVIASMVGGVSDIGIEVFQTMKQAKFGRSVLAGFVIALLAMMLDRVSRAFAGQRTSVGATKLRYSWESAALVAAAVTMIALATVIPELRGFPDSLTVHPAPYIDAALDEFTQIAFPITSSLKTWTVYHILLPLKSGLPQSIRVNAWGFEMSDFVSYTYGAVVSISCFGLIIFRRWNEAMALFFLAIYYYFGTTGTPWPLTVGLIFAMGYGAGGWKVGLLALGGMTFIVSTGGWERAMISLELCVVGVSVSFVLGSVLGFWAASNRRVSAVMRPICDTLQTMPIFVFLIPAVMIFLVGEFTALIAIILYAIVPAIRYAELGIRSVPADLTEAARMMGVTRWQMLWQIEVPVTVPELALGLNQTIMMALAMVIVASLVGAPGLGQDVMIALGEADTGRGLVAGISIALIAIVFDRIIQSWSAQRKIALGLTA
jgi:glycine betaine/proline transport system permease protein